MTAATRTAIFDRVVCGVDRSDEGLAAARAAALVAEPSGELTLVTAYDRSAAVHAGWGMLEAGQDAAWPLHDADAKLVEGDPLRTLLAEIERREATLAVVGSHGLSRPVGIVLGSVATYLLHEARCAVLVVRGEVVPGRWPRRIAVGLDGSSDSAQAYEAARALAARSGPELRALVATQDAHVDVEAAKRVAPECEEHDARALDVLNVASETADLVVVGSRGLRGLRAVGSLSERLAHEARSSVLVVRAG
jgi:nucleotide-binding universal stress UspA family protein